MTNFNKLEKLVKFLQKWEYSKSAYDRSVIYDDIKIEISNEKILLLFSIIDNKSLTFQKLTSCEIKCYDLFMGYNCNALNVDLRNQKQLEILQKFNSDLAEFWKTL